MGCFFIVHIKYNIQIKAIKEIKIRCQEKKKPKVDILRNDQFVWKS